MLKKNGQKSDEETGFSGQNKRVKKERTGDRIKQLKPTPGITIFFITKAAPPLGFP